jgi:hypothetical protein
MSAGGAESDGDVAGAGAVAESRDIESDDGPGVLVRS